MRFYEHRSRGWWVLFVLYFPLSLLWAFYRPPEAEIRAEREEWARNLREITGANDR